MVRHGINLYAVFVIVMGDYMQGDILTGEDNTIFHEATHVRMLGLMSLPLMAYWDDSFLRLYIAEVIAC